MYKRVWSLEFGVERRQAELVGHGQNDLMAEGVSVSRNNKNQIKEERSLLNDRQTALFVLMI